MKIRNHVLGLVAALATLPAMSAEIDGKWNATVDSPQGPVNIVFEFKSTGEKLEGTMLIDMAGQGMPAMPISMGTIKGEDVAFKFELAMMPDAPPLVIDYKGKVKGDDLNLVSVLDFGQGPTETPVTAKRAKTEAAG